MRILHVLDRDTGGVPLAVKDFIDSTASHEHFLMAPHDLLPSLRILFEGSKISAYLPVPFILFSSLPRTVRELGISVVHAHSSGPGALTRITLRKKRVAIVYSPHCFAFERTDVPTFIRRIFWIVERILASNTSAFALCSAREMNLAKEISSGAAIYANVPNISRLNVENLGVNQSFDLVSLGRLCKQKNPMRFKEIYLHLRERNPDLTAVWIGDGDKFYRDELEKVGIKVTGAIAHSEVGMNLLASRVYLHTASWEGFPLAILDAHRAQLPIVVVAEPYSEAFPGQVLLTEEYLDDVQRLVLEQRAVAPGHLVAANIAIWTDFLASHTASAQRSSLLEVWQAAWHASKETSIPN